VFWPVAVNPVTIWNAPGTDALKCANLSIYAMSAAVLINLVFALLAIVFLLRISWSRAERRYLKLLDKAMVAPVGTGLSELPSPVRQ
jgi:hypothetical protein